MAATPLDRDVSLPGSAAVWGTRRVDRPSAERSGPSAAPLDVVEALSGLADEPVPTEGGIAEALLTWLTPRLRNPDTLTQARIVPLLGMAADMISHSADISPDIARLGALALEQELRTQRALAERRAGLSLGSGLVT